MAELRDVKMRILSIAGECPNGHKAGEEWVVGGKTPAGVCISAFSTCMPHLYTLRHGGGFPWEQEGTVTVGCPDSVNRVVWRLERC